MINSLQQFATIILCIINENIKHLHIIFSYSHFFRPLLDMSLYVDMYFFRLSRFTTFVCLPWCSSVQTKLILKLLPESIQIPSNSFNASSYKKYFPADVCSRIFENL